jgi:uncharacterized protein (TIGR03435 family)
MLQMLLAERFQLQLHRRTKLVSGYALAVAKNGLKIRAVEPSGPQRMNWGKGRLLAERASMGRFAEALSRMLGAPVGDNTGVSGEFSFKLEWTPESSQAVPAGRNGCNLGRDRGCGRHCSLRLWRYQHQADTRAFKNVDFFSRC